MWCKGGLIKRCCSGVNRGGGSSGSRGAIDAFWKTRRRSCIFYWTLPGSSEKSRENNANAKKSSQIARTLRRTQRRKNERKSHAPTDESRAKRADSHAATIYIRIRHTLTHAGAHLNGSAWNLTTYEHHKWSKVYTRERTCARRTRTHVHTHAHIRKDSWKRRRVRSIFSMSGSRALKSDNQ